MAVGKLIEIDAGAAAAIDRAQVNSAAQPRSPTSAMPAARVASRKAILTHRCYSMRESPAFRR